MSEATFTFRVDENLKVQFTTAANGRDRTGAQLLLSLIHISEPTRPY